MTQERRQRKGKAITREIGQLQRKGKEENNMGKKIITGERRK